MRKWLGTLVALVVGAVGWVATRQQARFVAGGALINLGLRMQDPIEPFDLSPRGATPSPDAVLREILRQNELAAGVRARFPRSTHHPLVALVVCMDARLDTSELVGDTRKYYYIVRTAGSVLSPREEEMLELAVENGVKAIVLTTHTDCAAERVARTPELRARYPELAASVDQRDARWAELRERPAIRERLARGELAIMHARIDSVSDQLVSEAQWPGAHAHDAAHP